MFFLCFSMTINNQSIKNKINNHRPSDSCYRIIHPYRRVQDFIYIYIIHMSALKSIFTHSQKGEVKLIVGWWSTMIRNGRFISPTNHPGSTFQTDISHRRFIRFPTRSSSTDLSHYTVLGLTPLASQAEVKRVYKRLALKVFLICPLLFLLRKSSKLLLHLSNQIKKTKQKLNKRQNNFEWLQFHPDVHKGKDKDFKEIKSAYEVIIIYSFFLVSWFLIFFFSSSFVD